MDFKRGRADLTTFLEEHDPTVILWDVAIPYDENWEYLQEVRQLRAAAGRHFVLTSFNVEALQEFIGETPILEIIGKPLDLEQLTAAIGHRLQASAGDGQGRQQDLPQRSAEVARGDE